MRKSNRLWMICFILFLTLLFSACGGEGADTTVGQDGNTTEAPSVSDPPGTTLPDGTTEPGSGTTEPESVTTEPPAGIVTTEPEASTTMEDSPMIPGELTPSVVDYRWEEINGSHYLVFDDISLYDFYNNHFACSEFKSLQKFYDTVTKNELLLQDKIIAATAFYQDEIGIEVVDIHDLLIPGEDLFEKTGINEWVLWYGGYYSFSCCRGEEYWNFSCYTKNAYERYLEKITGFLADEGMTEIGREEERNATIYQGKNTRDFYVVYTVETEDRTFWVREEYRMYYSKTVPSNVAIVSTDPEERFVFKASHPEERPSLEWIASLYATPFVPETE